MANQNTFTLIAGDDTTIDLSQKNLGTADAGLLSAWLTIERRELEQERARSQQAAAAAAAAARQAAAAAAVAARQAAAAAAVAARQVAAQSAVTGFTQGLAYLQTHRIDLSGVEFGDVSSIQVVEIATRCPDLEALFLPAGTRLDESTLVAARRDCPKAKCIKLGCEISESAYLELLAQHGKHDAELAAALSQLSLPEGTPPAGDNLEPEPEDGASPGGLCRVLDLTGRSFARLTDSGLAELPGLCPDVTAVFLPADSKVTQAGLNEFRRQSPGVRCLSLGAEVGRVPLLHALRVAKESQRLNLCRNDDDISQRHFKQLSDAGLAELAALCPGLEAVFTAGDPSKITPEGRAALKAACPIAKCVDLGCEISEGAYDALVTGYAATQTLDLTGDAYDRLTDVGLREVSVIFQAEGELVVVIFTTGLKQRAVLDSRSCSRDIPPRTLCCLAMKSLCRSAQLLRRQGST